MVLTDCLDLSVGSWIVPAVLAAAAQRWVAVQGPVCRRGRRPITILQQCLSSGPAPVLPPLLPRLLLLLVPPLLHRMLLLLLMVLLVGVVVVVVAVLLLLLLL